MTEDFLSDRPRYGRTFRTAMGVIGGIASIQVLALGFGVLRRGPVLIESKLAPASLAPGLLETAAATMPFPAEGPHDFGDGTVPADGLATSLIGLSSAGRRSLYRVALK